MKRLTPLLFLTACFPGAPAISTVEAIHENHCEAEEPASCERSLLRRCVRGQWKITECEANERCDAGRAECREILCGDGLKEADEACDEGRENSLDGDCLPSCMPTRCGDGLIQGRSSREERCDDGNELSGDGCSALCQPE